MPESMLRHFRWVSSRTHVTWLDGLSKWFWRWSMVYTTYFPNGCPGTYWFQQDLAVLLCFSLGCTRCVCDNESCWGRLTNECGNTRDCLGIQGFTVILKYSRITILAWNIPIYRVLYMQDVPQPQSLNLKHESNVQIPNGLIMSNSAC